MVHILFTNNKTHLRCGCLKKNNICFELLEIPHTAQQDTIHLLFGRASASRVRCPPPSTMCLSVCVCVFGAAQARRDARHNDNNYPHHTRNRSSAHNTYRFPHPASISKQTQCAFVNIIHCMYEYIYIWRVYIGFWAMSSSYMYTQRARKYANLKCVLDSLYMMRCVRDRSTSFRGALHANGSAAATFSHMSHCCRDRDHKRTSLKVTWTVWRLAPRNRRRAVSWIYRWIKKKYNV